MPKNSRQEKAVVCHNLHQDLNETAMEVESQLCKKDPRPRRHVDTKGRPNHNPPAATLREGSDSNALLELSKFQNDKSNKAQWITSRVQVDVGLLKNKLNSIKTARHRRGKEDRLVCSRRQSTSTSTSGVKSSHSICEDTKANFSEFVRNHRHEQSNRKDQLHPSAQKVEMISVADLESKRNIATCLEEDSFGQLRWKTKMVDCDGDSSESHDEDGNIYEFSDERYSGNDCDTKTRENQADQQVDAGSNQTSNNQDKFGSQIDLEANLNHAPFDDQLESGAKAPKCKEGTSVESQANSEMEYRRKLSFVHPFTSKSINSTSNSSQSKRSSYEKPSSSTVSDVFETGVGSLGSRLGLTRARFSRRSSVSVDSVRLMFKRNLIATLVGAYICVSLTFIVILILPYLANSSSDARGHMTSHLNADSFVDRSRHSDDHRPKDILETMSIGASSEEVHLRVESSYSRSDNQQKSEDLTVQTKKRMAVVKEPPLFIKSPEGHAIEPAPEANNSIIADKSTKSRGFLSLWNQTYDQPCQPLTIPLCSQTLDSTLSSFIGSPRQRSKSRSNELLSLVPYDKTMLPNSYMTMKQSQIEEVLKNYTLVVNVKCYALLPLFLCSIHAPKCVNVGSQSINSPRQTVGATKTNSKSTQKSNQSKLVPPCRSLCREALRKCTFFLEVLSLEFINPDDCDALPESADPNVCVGQRENNLSAEIIRNSSCQKDHFRCANGECVPQKWRCDGYADCLDGSDEQQCSQCNLNKQFHCGQDVCINKSLVCNGIRDCNDGRDERQCLRVTSQNATSELTSRRLEIWSATNEAWTPVCGKYWLPMPMSVEACQALGFSRPVETKILIKPIERVIKNRAQQIAHIIDARSGMQSSWQDASRDKSYQSTETIPIDDLAGEKLMIEAVEGIDTSQVEGFNSSTQKSDYSVSHKFQILKKSNSSKSGWAQMDQMTEQRASGANGNARLQSLTSILYHGPDFGCNDKNSQTTSTVHLTCENFQCGRSIESHSNRLRINQHKATFSGRYISSSDRAKSEASINQSAASARFVVGGQESMPGEFPYLAALYGGPDEIFFCGGVLISGNWLLTAAHCVGNRTQPEGWTVKVGMTRRIVSPASLKKFKIRKIIKHPKFHDEAIFNNDIALILLEEGLEFDQYLRPICLPSADTKLEPEMSKDCVVAGFGKGSEDANYLPAAHFVNVPIVRKSTCSEWYAEHEIRITSGMICAGYAEGKHDACQGDSGSGLFCRYPNTNQFFIAGIVSFGVSCGRERLPGIYTSVPHYVDWIKENTKGFEINHN